MVEVSRCGVKLDGIIGIMGKPIEFGRLWFNAWGPSRHEDNDLLAAELRVADKLAGHFIVVHEWQVMLSLCLLRCKVSITVGISPREPPGCC